MATNGKRYNQIYPFNRLARKGDYVSIRPAASKVRAAAWAYSRRHGFKVSTRYNKPQTAVIITRL